MIRSELNKYRNVLQAQQAELVHLVQNRDGIAIETCPDALDEVQHATERELAIRNLDRDSNLLRNVRGALGLIAEGNFGVCLQCGENISPKRLTAVPWTPFCKFRFRRGLRIPRVSVLTFFSPANAYRNYQGGAYPHATTVLSNTMGYLLDSGSPKM